VNGTAAASCAGVAAGSALRAPQDDIHFHPAEPRSIRATFACRF
jgi:hypothetical protein